MADASSIRLLISNIAPGDLSNLIAIFSYQGFNPEMVMKHLSEIKLNKSISDEDFQADITALLCLGCIAGNYTGKNKQKRAEQGTAKADELYAKYNLKMGSVGEEKRAITLPRILLTFPIPTFTIMMLCPERNFSGPFSSSQLPHCMKNAVFPSLIHSSFGSVSKNALLIAYCGYTCDQTKAINDSMKNMSSEEIFNKQFEYVTIGNKSPEPSDAMRIATFKNKVLPDLQKGWAGICAVLTKYKELVNKSYNIPATFGSVKTVPVTEEESQVAFS